MRRYEPFHYVDLEGLYNEVFRQNVPIKQHIIFPILFFLNTQRLHQRVLVYFLFSKTTY